MQAAVSTQGVREVCRHGRGGFRHHTGPCHEPGAGIDLKYMCCKRQLETTGHARVVE